jgi:phosphoribosyl 1,2-cyclic phosphate phosphodiesterase
MNDTLKITFLGTGTSQGVPVIACDCKICKSDNEKDARLRTSILIESATTTVVIDSGPDFRQQMLANGVKKLDALIFTHSHKDHIAGMDDVRAFNYVQNKAVDVYANVATQEKIKVEFDYAFSGLNYPGIPKIILHTINANDDFTIGDITFTPIEVMHYKMPVLGFRIHDFTYITDANFISAQSFHKMKGTKQLVLNALRREPHISHFTLHEAIEIAQNLKSDVTYFTHISHQLGLHDEVEKELPENIFLAHDGLKISIKKV